MKEYICSKYTYDDCIYKKNRGKHGPEEVRNILYAYGRSQGYLFWAASSSSTSNFWHLKASVSLSASHTFTYNPSKNACKFKFEKASNMHFRNLDYYDYTSICSRKKLAHATRFFISRAFFPASPSKTYFCTDKAVPERKKVFSLASSSTLNNSCDVIGNLEGLAWTTSCRIA